jgi:hypothetical protein
MDEDEIEYTALMLLENFERTLPNFGLCASVSAPKDKKLLKLFQPEASEVNGVCYLTDYQYWASDSYEKNIRNNDFKKFGNMRKTICCFIAAMKGDL